MFCSVTSLNESQNKIHNLSCQVENLREMLDMKRSDERRKDEELMRLEESFRNEKREKSQLFKDNEQLQWKMRQRVAQCFSDDNHSKSFAGVTESDKGNFKTFTFQHSTLDKASLAPSRLNQFSTSFSADSRSVTSPMPQGLRSPNFSSTPSNPEQKKPFSVRLADKHIK